MNNVETQCVSTLKIPNFAAKLHQNEEIPFPICRSTIAGCLQSKRKQKANATK